MDSDNKNSNKNKNISLGKEDATMNATAIKKIDKSLLTGLTLEKKRIMKSLQGIASSPIDYNKIRDAQKNGKDKF